MESTRYIKNCRKEGECNMNYHSDEWIKEKLQEHYKYACEHYDEKLIIGLFLRGSQNYGLDDENSDVDTMLLVNPSIEDICLAKKPISTTWILSNDEHIDVKDIRLMQGQILKQSPQFMECLMTPYFILGSQAFIPWNNFINHKEYWFNYDRKKMIKAMRGYAHEKHHALEHVYPSRANIIEQFGYDPKQLMHLARYKQLVKEFALGKPFPDILICNDPEVEAYLRELKSGKFNIDSARRFADEILETADKYTQLVIDHEPDADKEKCKLIEDKLAYDIAKFVEYSLRQQFEREKNEKN